MQEATSARLYNAFTYLREIEYPYGGHAAKVVYPYWRRARRGGRIAAAYVKIRRYVLRTSNIGPVRNSAGSRQTEPSLSDRCVNLQFGITGDIGGDISIGIAACGFLRSSKMRAR